MLAYSKTIEHDTIWMPTQSGQPHFVGVGVGVAYVMTLGTGLETLATSSITVKVWAEQDAVGRVVTT